MTWALFFTYIFPPIVTGVLGLFAKTPLAPTSKNKEITDMVKKTGGKDIWAPIAKKLIHDYSPAAFQIILSAVQDSTNINGSKAKQEAAFQTAKHKLLNEGKKMSDSALNMLIEIAVQKIKN